MTDYRQLRNDLYKRFDDGSWKPFTLGGENGGHTNGWHRLNHCTASFKVDEKLNFVWLMSYSTIVAVFDSNEQILISFGRYSKTTSSHIRKFRDWIASNKSHCLPWNVAQENLNVEDFYNTYTFL